MKIAIFLGLVFALVAAASAQESTNYKLKEHTLNSGGSPEDGVNLTSANYQLTFSALGDSVTASNVSSANYQAGEGFVPPYPPPGEVQNLFFTDQSTLGWNPEPSVGSYTLYRGLLSDLGAGYGACVQTGLTTTSTTDNPPPVGAYFYLIAAENRLSETGSLGSNSSGAPRTAPCP